MLTISYFHGYSYRQENYLKSVNESIEPLRLLESYQEGKGVSIIIYFLLRCFLFLDTIYDHWTKPGLKFFLTHFLTWIV